MKIHLGHTFTIVDERTGRTLIGWSEMSLDAAIADALHQLNAARYVEFRVVDYVREYVGGDS